ncbi:MAG TPA: fibronectin type III domain-containing protein [Pyrinomonadaceae bacterium]|nr:fibronectin type III domain-containing protein [Pyrinomonadaceae bacterium]
MSRLPRFLPRLNPRVRLVVFCFLSVVIGGILPSLPVNAQSSTVGQWSSAQTWPYRAVHTQVLPTGKVIFWDSFSNADHPQLWDPTTGSVTPATQAGYNIFCTGVSFLADGRMFLAGGHISDNVGLPSTSVYDPFTNSWTLLPDMNAGRWYPTNTTLANGDVLVVSGMVDTTVGMNLLPQIWQQASGTWRNLTSAQLQLPYYPYMFLAPNGKIFSAGPNQTTRYLDTSGSGVWTVVGNNNYGTRNWGSAVMYDNGKVLISGGIRGDFYGAPSAVAPTATAEAIDLNAASPSWQYVASMAYPRKHHNLTLLPDGKVLVTGGSSGSEETNSNSANPVYAAEMWDPATNSWTTLASNSLYRGYHSTAVLLPDGRVLSAGGEDVVASAEIYSPPYLFRGARPTISSAPTAVSYGQTFFVGTPDATSTTTVTLVRLSSVTHTNNMDQRISRLSFSQATGGLNVTAPSSTNLCPPGYYMLFILNGNGVPSVARIVRVEVTPPAAPSSLIATVASSSQITLSWTDNSNDEDSFRIERCQGAGCTNFAEITTVAANAVSYSNTGLTASTTYRYRIRAYKGGGTSAYSNTASASTQSVLFPTTSILDNFNRANAGPPPSSNWAGPIQLAFPGLKVDTNTCLPIAAGGQGYWSAASFGPDQEAYAKVPTFGNSYEGVWLRVSNPNTFNVTGYVVHFYKAGFGTNTIRVFRLNNSSSGTQLGADIPQTIADGDSIGASIVGNVITVYYKIGSGAWTSLGTRIDNTYSSSGRIGLEIGAGSADDFGGGTVSTGVPAPAAPSGLSATAASTTQINLAWTDNSNNEDGFRIERCQNAGCSNFTEIATVAANVVTYQNTGLTAGTTYQYRVRAYNTGGNSAYSSSASATTSSPSPPAAPSGLSATAASTTQINLAWTDNSNNEDGFRIERCQNAGCSNFTEIATVAANVVTYQNTGLTAGTTYQYRVRAYNTGGNSAYSNTANATTTVTAPAAPTNLTASAVVLNQINLAWQDNSNNESGFKIERCQGATCTNFAEIATVGANVTTYQNTGLALLTTYRYRVYAFNGGGNSAYSNIASATTLLSQAIPANETGNLAWKLTAWNGSYQTGSLVFAPVGVSGFLQVALDRQSQVSPCWTRHPTSFIDCLLQ